MRISQIDLNLLLVLHTVLAERSVAAAARRLHVTPSAVSNALARLRDALGDPLVVRSGRGIVPTPRARELAPVLAQALGAVEQALTGPSFDPATTTRRFTLAVADAGQIVQAPRLAAALAKVMPRAKLRVVGIDSLVRLGGLAGTEVDVVVGAGEAGPGVRQALLREETAVLIARRDHPAVRRRISRAALGELLHAAVEMAPGSGLRDLTAAAYARAGIPREVAVTVPTFTAAAAMAAATDLVATVPRSLVEGLGRALDVRPVRAPAPAHPVAIYMSWHERTHTDPAMAAFRELVRAAWSSAERRRTGAGRDRSQAR
ncbi:MAG TPA: LysR family transcriptional regulator [Sandaracinaceae bacterium]